MLQDTDSTVGDCEVVQALFLARPNRFLSVLEIEGEEVEAFVPNPGRMHELLTPGRPVFARKREGQHRKTKYDLIALEHEGVMVSIDSNKPNRFMKRMLETHKLDFFGEYVKVVPEPPLFEGRSDFRLEGDEGIKLIEVKSCTLVEDGTALFPDAPTRRGTRHLHDLVMAKESGVADEVYVVFVIQRPDVRRFSVNRDMDPAFADALNRGVERGLSAHALRSRLKNWQLVFLDTVPIDLV